MKCIICGLCICHLQNSNGIMIEYTQVNIPKDVFLLLLSYGWCLFNLCYVMCHLSESGNDIWPCFWSWNLNIKLLSVSSSQSLSSRFRTATSRTCATTRTSSATSTPRWSAPSTTRWTRFSFGMIWRTREIFWWENETCLWAVQCSQWTCCCIVHECRIFPYDAI